MLNFRKYEHCFVSLLILSCGLVVIIIVVAAVAADIAVFIGGSFRY